jgi:fumarate reductase flavoprotein subunit
MAVEGKKFDVIVVGAGFAGLVAACRAAELGSSVLLLDKGGLPGDGNTMTTSGEYFTAGLHPSSKPDELYSRAMRGGAANPSLARAWAENVGRALGWLEQVGIQVEKNPDASPRLEPKNAVSSSPVYRAEVGASIVRKLRAFFESHLGVSLSKTRVTKLLTKGGAVIGVEALDGAGGRVAIRGPATVLATGGFQADRKLLKKYVGKHADACKLMGSSNATGDGLRMAVEAHARAVNLQYVHAKLVSLKAQADDRFWPYPTLDSLVEDGILVDKRGRRFRDEGWGDVPLANDIARWDDVSSACLVFDQLAWERAKTSDSSIVPANPYLQEKDGLLFKGEGALDLASKIGVDPKGLETTIESFNAASLRRRLGELDIPRFTNVRPLRPPLYGLRVVPGIISTMGGPLVNRRGGVVDTKGRSITGLFAAGDLVGGLMGGHHGGYVGGLSQAAVTGLLCGESAHKLAMSTT